MSKTNCGSVILELDFRLITKHSVLLGMSCAATLDYYDITLNWVLPMTSSEIPKNSGNMLSLD